MCFVNEKIFRKNYFAWLLNLFLPWLQIRTKKFACGEWADDYLINKLREHAKCLLCQ
jgi:hypothetical protein